MDFWAPRDMDNLNDNNYIYFFPRLKCRDTFFGFY